MAHTGEELAFGLACRFGFLRHEHEFLIGFSQFLGHRTDKEGHTLRQRNDAMLRSLMNDIHIAGVRMRLTFPHTDCYQRTVQKAAASPLPV